MTQVRLTIEGFAKDVEGALAALGPNDEVVLEREGKVIARLKPEPVKTDWEAFFKRRASEPPLDDKFEQDVLDVIAERNEPVQDIDWEF
jgi:hypothetical protein